MSNRTLSVDETRARMLCHEYGHYDPHDTGRCWRCAEPVPVPTSLIVLRGSENPALEGKWIDRLRAHIETKPRGAYPYMGSEQFRATGRYETNESGQVAEVYEAYRPSAQIASLTVTL